MANLVVLPESIVNGDKPDVVRIMTNLNKCNDRIYVCTEATKPAVPYIGQIIIVTDSAQEIACRIYWGGGWKAIPLMDIE